MAENISWICCLSVAFVTEQGATAPCAIGAQTITLTFEKRKNYLFAAELTHGRQEALLKSISLIWGLDKFKGLGKTWGNAGRTSFDWRVLDLSQLWYRVEEQEKAQRNSRLVEFDWSVLYLLIFGLGTRSSLLKDFSLPKGL